MDAQVAELHAGIVGEESDMAGGAFQARMFLQHLRVGDGGEIGIDNHGAIQLHDDAGAAGGDLLGIPFADRLQKPGLGGENIVDGAVILGGAEFAFVHGRIVIEDLNLHALVGGVAFEGRADADPVIGCVGQLEVEAQNEISVLGLREEVSVTIRRRDEEPIFDEVAGASGTDKSPAVERVSVEEIHESGFGGVGERGEKKECLDHLGDYTVRGGGAYDILLKDRLFLPCGFLLLLWFTRRGNGPILNGLVVALGRRLVAIRLHRGKHAFREEVLEFPAGRGYDG